MSDISAIFSMLGIFYKYVYVSGTVDARLGFPFLVRHRLVIGSSGGSCLEIQCFTSEIHESMYG